MTELSPMATGEPVEFRPPWWATKYNPLIDGAPSSLQLCMLLWILHYLGDRWAAKYNESQFRYRGVSGTMTQGPSSKWYTTKLVEGGA